MAFFKKIIDKLNLKKHFKRKSALLIVFLIIILIFSLRSCSQGNGITKKEYTIGRDSSWYPLQLLGRERSLIAFTNDLMAIISRDIDLNFIWVETTPNELMEGLSVGNYDAVLTSYRPDITNLERYTFSDLIVKLGPVLVVRQDSAITSLKDLKGQSVGMGSSAFLIYNAIRESGANTYEINLVSYKNMNQALDALTNNQIDGVIMEALPAYTMVNGLYHGLVKIVSSSLTNDGLRLMTFKTPTNEAMIKEFNADLQKVKAKGTYAELINKWSLVDPEKQYWHPADQTQSKEK